MAKENIHRAMGSLAYAIAVADGTIQKKEKEVIKSGDQVKAGDLLQITLAHGHLEARVEQVTK